MGPYYRELTDQEALEALAGLAEEQQGSVEQTKLRSTEQVQQKEKPIA
jgi:hypothetical protein